MQRNTSDDTYDPALDAPLFVRAKGRIAWAEYYPDHAALVADRAALEGLADRLGISRPSIHSEENGRLHVMGKHGTLRWTEAGTCRFLLGPPTKKAWRWAKQLLAPPMRLRLDCDFEGIFLFDPADPRIVALLPTVRRLGGFRAAYSPEVLEARRKRALEIFGTQEKVDEE